MHNQVPSWLKWLATIFVAVLIPVYAWEYGPSNFLWFSDIALFMTVAALWLERPLFASVPLVSVGLLELVWTIDFVWRLITGSTIIGLAEYMFDPAIPLFIRRLSLFHLLITPLLIWLVWRIGYDRRAWFVQSAMACVVLPLTYLITDPAKNINWVYGLGEKPQTSIPELLYLMLLMIAFPLCVYLPTHLLLSWLAPRPASATSAGA